MQCSKTLTCCIGIVDCLNFSVNKYIHLYFRKSVGSYHSKFFSWWRIISNSKSCWDLRVLVKITLKFHLNVFEIYSKACHVSQSILSIVCISSKFILKSFFMHIRPIINFTSSVWNTKYLSDLHLLECVQKR